MLASRSQRAEQALEETAHHVVKALNSPVPVQVQEALRGDLAGELLVYLSRRRIRLTIFLAAVSVKLHVSGWAWLVRGNRVLLWRYTPVQTVVSRLTAFFCFCMLWYHSTWLVLVSNTGSLLPVGPFVSIPFQWMECKLGHCMWTAFSHSVWCSLEKIFHIFMSVYVSVSLLAASLDGHLHYWDNILRERPTPSEDGMVDVGTGRVIVATPILKNSGVILFTSEGRLFLVSLPSQSQVHVH